VRIKDKKKGVEKQGEKGSEKQWKRGLPWYTQAYFEQSRGESCKTVKIHCQFCRRTSA
jgi:hypothetical protein